MISDRWRKFFRKRTAGAEDPRLSMQKSATAGALLAGDDAPKIKMSMETMERALEELEGKTNG